MQNIVKIASPDDLPFIIDLAKKFTNQLGFIPRVGVEEYIRMGRVRMVMENDCPAGFLLGRASMKYNRAIQPITQAAVCMDAQRRSLGLELVASLEAEAIANGRKVLQAWCAEDIDAKSFWAAAGFVPVMDREAENSRNRRLILFRKPLLNCDINIYEVPPLAGWKASKLIQAKQLMLFGK